MLPLDTLPRRRSTRIALIPILTLLLLQAAPALAVFSGTSPVAADTTIYEDTPDDNGGAIAGICIGNMSATTATRRALVRYDLPAIQSGSTITRVRVQMTQERARKLSPPDTEALSATMRLYRVTGGSWDEGTGTSVVAGACGGGSAAPGVDWSSAPSFSSSISATELLPGYPSGSVQLPELVFADTNTGTDDDVLLSDVQAWFDGSPNDGWLVRVSQEATLDNARVLTPGPLYVEWTATNGIGCGFDGDCTSGHCVGPDGANCGGAVGCVCCDVATCGAGSSCQVPGSEGVCTATAPVPASDGLGLPFLLTAAILVGSLGAAQLAAGRA